MKVFQQRIQAHITKKYQKTFFIFHLKSVNTLLSNTKTKASILFQDLRFDSDDIQYLKRYYMANQSLVRILKLINYYQCNLVPPDPNFIQLSAYHLMAVRHRKIIKLQELKQQSLARKRQKQQKIVIQQNFAEQQHEENILQHLSAQNLSQIDSNQQNEQNYSFDEQVHDIYALPFNSLQSRSRIAYSSTGPEQYILQVKYIKQSELIIDFKDSQKQKNVLKNTNFDDSYLKKPNISGKPQYLPVVSPQQKQKSQKLKKSSFMGYYNSLQKKQPSKIIEKYIKQKK